MSLKLGLLICFCLLVATPFLKKNWYFLKQFHRALIILNFSLPEYFLMADVQT